MRDITDIRLADSIPNAVVRLFRQFNRLHNVALKPTGLSTVQAHILSALFAEGPMTIGVLQQLLSLGSSTLTGALDRMEKQGLVARQPVPDDRRATQLVPAAWSKKRKSALFATLAAAEDACLAALSAKERRELLRLLTKLNAAHEQA
jgi:DNA-binding MarR family transcriptional regulator